MSQQLMGLQKLLYMDQILKTSSPGTDTLMGQNSPGSFLLSNVKSFNQSGMLKQGPQKAMRIPATDSFPIQSCVHEAPCYQLWL